MSTTNYFIGPENGWVEIASSPKFARVSAFPHTHPYYLYSGATAPTLFPAAGTGTVIFTGLPVAAQTVTIGTEVYTFRAAAALPFEVTIGGTGDITAANMAAVITANSTLVNASVATGTVTVTAKRPGTQGNYAMSETATNVAVGGALMTGGTDPVAGLLMCHHPFKVNVTMTEKLFARVVSPVPNSQFPGGKLRLDVFVIT